ncbi:uncharacterized protein TNCV_2598851 [Trichonephila clavipes]|nr:uncharacterized protein TNCV_2598851 [Trichonephila clavipes]
MIPELSTPSTNFHTTPTGGHRHVAAVAEWLSYRIVAGLVTSSSPVPLKTRRAPDLDICEGNKLIMSFKTFISNVRHESYQKLKEYQDTVKKLSPSIETEHSDVNKRRNISKFADKSTEKAMYEKEKFKRDRLIVSVLC